MANPFLIEPSTNREEIYRRYKAFVGALILSMDIGIYSYAIYYKYNLNKNEALLIQKYEELFDSPDKIFDLNKFSLEDCMCLALNFTTSKYAKNGYELRKEENLGITEQFGEGGVCRHDAQFLVDFLNMFDNSYAYYITGAYKGSDSPDNHAIVAWKYTLNGLHYYELFIDATQCGRTSWILG